MSLLESRIKSLVSLGIAYGLAALLLPDSIGFPWPFAVVIGGLIPVVNGLVWGKENWDDNPVIYVFAFLLLLFFYYLTGRLHRIEPTIPFWIGLIGAQTFLFYSGKPGKLS